jgi:hypothetical protein
MKIELRNVKVSEFASEETTCFEAAVYLDGIKAGIASNQGFGGPNLYFPSELEARLEAYAKTLPGSEFEYEGRMIPVPESADGLIDKALDDFLNQKALRRKFKASIKKGLVTLFNNELRLIRGGGTKNIPQDATILNNLPEEEAFALFCKYITYV